MSNEGMLSEVQHEVRFELYLKEVFERDKKAENDEGLTKFCAWISASLENGAPVIRDEDLEVTNGIVKHTITGICGFGHPPLDLHKKEAKEYKLIEVMEATENLRANLQTFLVDARFVSDSGVIFEPSEIKAKYEDLKKRPYTR